jgi:hypothetical protein
MCHRYGQSTLFLIVGWLLLEAMASLIMWGVFNDRPAGIGNEAKARPGQETSSGAYHQLFQLEKSFRMSKTRPAGPANLLRQTRIHRRHLTIVFAAMAVSHWIEVRTGWSIKRFTASISIIIEFGSTARACAT